MIIIMPPAPKAYKETSLNSILDYIKRALIPVVSRTEATDRILMRSPSGTTYSVSVNDSGTLITAIEDGKSRNI